MTPRDWETFLASIRRTAADVVATFKGADLTKRKPSRYMRRKLDLERRAEIEAARPKRKRRMRGPSPAADADPAPENMGPVEPVGRSTTIALKTMLREARIARRTRQIDGPMLGPNEEPLERPRTRADCVGACRPCPWVSCKWNLFLDVNTTGGLQLNFPGLEVEQVPHNCALDLADIGGLTLDQIGQAMNVTRERIRQIEADALARMLKLSGDLDTPTQAEGFDLPDGPPRQQRRSA